MRILGIDPGSNVTGYALLEMVGGETRLVESGVLRPGRNSPLAQRLASIQIELESLLDRCHPDETAVEDLFHAISPASSLRLAHARGAILSALARAGQPVAEYTPLQVKKAVSGYGLADKDALRALVERLLNIPAGVLTRDASDAVAVAICHAQAVPLRAAIACAAERDGASGTHSPRRGSRRNAGPTG